MAEGGSIVLSVGDNLLPPEEGFGRDTNAPVWRNPYPAASGVGDFCFVGVATN
jgi:hypothetical protein